MKRFPTLIQLHQYVYLFIWIQFEWKDKVPAQVRSGIKGKAVSGDPLGFLTSVEIDFDPVDMRIVQDQKQAILGRRLIFYYGLYPPAMKLDAGIEPALGDVLLGNILPCFRN